jgi:superfamily I DNA/RNA helicase
LRSIFRGRTLVRQWLAARIYEVEKAIGRLPSVAVFVDGDDLIDPLVNVTHIQHIKGLEFEAVFFIGIDGLAQRLPDLFQRFLYVGVTRAAPYLAVTCERALPNLIEPLRSHFGMSSDWAET